MAKNLSDRITARIHAKKLTGIAKNRSEFLAIHNDVKKAINDGWPIKVIWETLRDERKISFGYHSFINYVNRFIRPTDAMPSSAPSSIQKTNAKKLVQPTDTHSKLIPSGIPSFNYNPQMDDKDLF